MIFSRAARCRSRTHGPYPRWMSSRLENNKHNVMAFYDLMFNQCEPREAMQKYAGAGLPNTIRTSPMARKPSSLTGSQERQHDGLSALFSSERQKTRFRRRELKTRLRSARTSVRKFLESMNFLSSL